MSRKLPQAIGRTFDDMRSSASAARSDTVRAVVSGALVARTSPAGGGRETANTPSPTAGNQDAALAAVPAHNGKTAAPDREKPAAAAMAPAADDHGVLRRSRGREIIERHATYAAFSGLIPLPIIDIVGVTAIVTHMAGALARLYGVGAQRDRTRAVVLGILSGTAPVGLGVLASSSLLRLVPGANLVGMAVTSITAAVCTRSIGLVFLEHFESGGTLLDFKVEQGRAALEAAKAAANAKAADRAR